MTIRRAEHVALRCHPGSNRPVSNRRSHQRSSDVLGLSSSVDIHYGKLRIDWVRAQRKWMCHRCARPAGENRYTGVCMRLVPLRCATQLASLLSRPSRSGEISPSSDAEARLDPSTSGGSGLPAIMMRAHSPTGCPMPSRRSGTSPGPGLHGEPSGCDLPGLLLRAAPPRD